MSAPHFRFSDRITPELRRIAAELGGNTRRLMAAAGKEMERALRNHFHERDNEPNARGWPKKHFWRKEVSANTALTEVAERRAVVSISSPAFAHKVTGGTITPKRGKALSIPLTSEAYLAGSASLFPRKLHPQGRSLADEQGVAQYALVRSVSHDPDPRAWPERETLENAILIRAQAFLARVLRTPSR